MILALVLALIAAPTLFAVIRASRAKPTGEGFDPNGFDPTSFETAD